MSTEDNLARLIRQHVWNLSHQPVPDIGDPFTAHIDDVDAQRIAAAIVTDPRWARVLGPLDDVDLGPLPITASDLAEAYRNGVRHGWERAQSGGPKPAILTGGAQ